MEGRAQPKSYGSQVLPYIYFIGLASFWLFGDLFAMQKFSFVALGVIVALTIQAVLQHKVVGASLGIMAIAISLIAFLATLSEFSDFEVVNQSAIQLIAVGSVLSLSELVMGGMLTITNIRRLAI